MSCVYALVAKSDLSSVRYVGRSRFDTPDKRLKNHSWAAGRGSNKHVYNWIRKVVESNDEVISITLESNISHEESVDREIYWIKFYKDAGHRLTNMTDGGEGTINPTSETRKKIGDAQRGKIVSSESRKKMSDSQKIVMSSAEHREKLSNANKGRKHTLEARQKITAAQLGRVPYVMTDDIRKKISETLTGRPLSPEHRAKIGAGVRGKKRSAETIEKMKKSQQIRRKRDRMLDFFNE